MNNEQDTMEMLDDDDAGFTLGEEEGAEGAEHDPRPADGAGTGQQEETGTQEGDGSEGGKPEETYELTDDLGGSRKVNRQELTELARRGLSHDRMVQQIDGMKRDLDELGRHREANAGILAELQELAGQAGVDMPTYLAALQENVLVSKGMRREDAKAMVQRQRQQAAEQARQAAQMRQRQQAVRQRQEEDIRNFISRWPNTDPKTIPQSVWDAVRGGEPLVSAYGWYEAQQLREENKRLQEQLAAKKQNDNNKNNAIGSMQSAGSGPKPDSFLSGFNGE